MLSAPNECIQCGRCCYFKGTACRFLSNTQKCIIYNVRIGALCGYDDMNVPYFCTYREHSRVKIDGCNVI